jgi:hypothetical protein
MKETVVLINEAKKIISQEHLSSGPRMINNTQVSKKLRKFFVSSCLTDIGAPFTSRVAGYMVKD